MFSCIEDYLVAIYKFAFISTTKPLRLARYDLPFINAVDEQIVARVPLTDKQLALAKLLVLKYTKQLKRKGVLVDAQALNQTRLGVRKIDRRKSLSIVDNKLQLHFPYIENLIVKIREYAKKESCGAVVWDAKDKVWNFALTEPNALWAYNFAIENNFEISEQVVLLINEINKYAKRKDFLTLVKENNHYKINDAAQTLVDATAHFTSLLEYADNATVFGYRISEQVANEVSLNYDELTTQLIVNNNVETLNRGTKNHITDYIKLSNRFPTLIVGNVWTKDELVSAFPDRQVREGMLRKDTYFIIGNDKGVTLYTIVPRLTVLDTNLIGNRGLNCATSVAEKTIWTCCKL